jgi:hypothetical protein
MAAFHPFLPPISAGDSQLLRSGVPGSCDLKSARALIGVQGAKALNFRLSPYPSPRKPNQRSNAALGRPGFPQGVRAVLFIITDHPRAADQSVNSTVIDWITAFSSAMATEYP